MELGPLQKEWISRLRAHSERHMTGCLGKGNESIYRACCLGEAVVMLRGQSAFIDNLITCKEASGNTRSGTLDTSTTEDLGLFSSTGSLAKKIRIGDREFNSLVDMNDGGKSWTEIADIMERWPELVFTSSK